MQLGVQYFAQGYFDMQVGESRVRTTNLLISTLPTLPPRPSPPYDGFRQYVISSWDAMSHCIKSICDWMSLMQGCPQMIKTCTKKAHFETTNIFIKRTHFFNQCIDSVARLCLLPDRLISAFLQSDRALCGFDCACGRCYSKGAVEVAASHHVFKWQGKHVCANAKRCTTLCVGRLHPAGQFLHCFNWNR